MCDSTTRDTAAQNDAEWEELRAAGLAVTAAKQRVDEARAEWAKAKGRQRAARKAWVECQGRVKGQSNDG